MTKSNTAWLFLFLGSLGVMYLGKELGGRQGLLLGFLIALCANAAVFFYGEIRLIKLFNAKKLEGRDPYKLVELSKELAFLFKIPTPSLLICDLASPTAFSIGRNFQSSAIILSRQLVEKLEPEELRAVLACEMYKIKEQLTFAATLYSAMSAFVLGISEFTDRVLTLNKIKKEELGPITGLTAPLVSKFIRSSQSKRKLLETETRACEPIKANKHLASAIWKLDTLVKTQPSLVPKDTAHLFFMNPLPQYGWAKMFQSPVSAQERIENLTGQYPI